MYGDCVKISESANVVKEAVVVGDVTVEEELHYPFPCPVSAAMRRRIVVGRCSNIQDNCTIHADTRYPAVIGAHVTVGHNAVLHGCTVGDGSLIGMGAVVLNGAQIGRECLIGAGSLVLEGQVIPDGSLAVGNPAKVKRMLTEAERRRLYESSQAYIQVGRNLRAEGYCRMP